jgi:hypothetical protein
MAIDRLASRSSSVTSSGYRTVRLSNHPAEGSQVSRSAPDSVGFGSRVDGVEIDDHHLRVEPAAGACPQARDELRSPSRRKPTVVKKAMAPVVGELELTQVHTTAGNVDNRIAPLPIDGLTHVAGAKADVTNANSVVAGIPAYAKIPFDLPAHRGEPYRAPSNRLTRGNLR